MRELDHTNCCRLFYYYSEKTEAGKPEMSINLVMEYVSDTLSAIVSRSRKQSEDINHFLIQLYLYQLLRGTAYMHSKKIAHRYQIRALQTRSYVRRFLYCFSVGRVDDRQMYFKLSADTMSADFRNNSLLYDKLLQTNLADFCTTRR